MIKVGDEIYGYHCNNRRDNDLPQYWERYKVVGETRICWLVGYASHPIKVDKKTMIERGTKYTPIRFVATKEEVERENFISNSWSLAEEVRCCKDYDKLLKIKEILDN